ncbi:hypothetical protein Vretimale_6674 [Volvox reticuliferus]|uniref:Alkyl transferase n=1 Tax=Volvox reticuliferus TaxID=1737510 RepID=A0A8J4G7Z4_9CHLO|nr:hypothetical protein Vretimale_6674 [Volvox reticuliferus]
MATVAMQSGTTSIRRPGIPKAMGRQAIISGIIALFCMVTGCPPDRHHRRLQMVDVIHWCIELGVKYITVYAFSIDNFKRSPDEVGALMRLAEEKYIELAQDNGLAAREGIQMHIVGDLELPPPAVQGAAARLMQATTALPRRLAALNVCFSYTASEESVTAVHEIQEAVRAGRLLPDDVTPEALTGALRTGPTCPPVDLLIRTSGETRLSDFLLWQAAHAHLCYLHTLWPDLSYWDFARCVLSYQRHARALAALRRRAAVRLAAAMQPPPPPKCISDDVTSGQSHQHTQHTQHTQNCQSQLVGFRLSGPRQSGGVRPAEAGQGKEKLKAGWVRDAETEACEYRYPSSSPATANGTGDVRSSSSSSSGSSSSGIRSDGSSSGGNTHMARSQLGSCWLRRPPDGPWWLLPLLPLLSLLSLLPLLPLLPLPLSWVVGVWQALAAMYAGVELKRGAGGCGNGATISSAADRGGGREEERGDVVGRREPGEVGVGGSDAGSGGGAGREVRLLRFFERLEQARLAWIAGHVDL